MNKAEWLNQKLKHIYSEDEIVEQFIYFTNKSRGKHCKESTIRDAYRNNTLGQLIKKMDPIYFHMTE